MKSFRALLINFMESTADDLSKKQVELGTIEITKAVASSAAAERELLFLPAALPAGIEAEDPMIIVRSTLYAVSFGRRK